MILELPYMAAELGLLSLTQLQILAQQSLQEPQANPSLTGGGGGGGGGSSWMWNNNSASRRPVEEDDDSWEVRAFAEDTGNIMGTTWPPRSYTCTFCRREFRSAQALGGHMNVHRRDRARLRQSPPVSSLDPSSSSQELIGTPNHGLCLLYPLASNSSTVFTSAEAAAASMSIFTSATAVASVSGCINHQSVPSTLLSISPYPPSGSPISFPGIVNPSIHYANSSFCHSPTGSKLEKFVYNQTQDATNNIQYVEELDLELRLGTRPSPSP